MRGPPPKPTRLKILSRNPGKRKISTREPQPRAATPTMPTWLSPDGKTEWKRIVPQLRQLGLLTLVDRAALAAYCQAWAELCEATRILNTEGRVIGADVFNKEGDVVGEKKVLNPAVKIQKEAYARVKQFVAEFGLTPASRTRVKGNTPGESEGDSFDDFLRKKA